MKKSIIIISFYSLLISCTNEIKSKPKFEFPKYSISKENFTNKIKEVDTVIIGYSYEIKSGLFSNSSVNKLSIELYYDNDKSRDDTFMKNQFEEIKENAKKEILNLSQYDVLELKIFNQKSEIKSFEEIIK